MPRIFSFILSASSNGSNKGLGIKISEFFRNAFRSDLIEDLVSINTSSVIKARNKIPYEEFSDAMDQAVKVAYDNFPKSDKYQWKNLSVYAVDGSKYTLPFSEELRKEFDPNCGFDKMNTGKGHYPQCMVSTVYDIFRKIPIARAIAPVNVSEREEFLSLLPKIPEKGLLVFDRGYPSYEMFDSLIKQYNGYFLFRSSVSNTFKEVEEFLKSEKTDGVITLKANYRFLKKKKLKSKDKLQLRLRIVVSVRPNGEKIVFLSNLFDSSKYKSNEICDLYYKRWEVEVNYRNEKESVEIEHFHSKNTNGIKQEIYAVAIMTIITRTISAMNTEDEDIGTKEPQFKNAIITLANDVTIFVAEKIKNAIKIFKQIIVDIKKRIYYKPKNRKNTYKRISKEAKNKWILKRKKIILNP